MVETQKRFTERWLAFGQILPLRAQVNLLSTKHFFGHRRFLSKPQWAHSPRLALSVAPAFSLVLKLTAVL